MHACCSSSGLWANSPLNCQLACSLSPAQAFPLLSLPCSCPPALPCLQQDIARGRDMVDSLFQGFGSGMGGTHNAVLSSAEYLSTAGKTIPLFP